MSATLRIATRKSQLALWQAQHVAMLLRQAHAGLAVELVPLLTQGDRIQDRSLAAIGGKGLFIKELEVAIAEHRADIAVHSMKDVPADLPDGLMIGAVLKRADALDALVTVTGIKQLKICPPAPASVPRACGGKRSCAPCGRILPSWRLRGNVDTRLRKLDAGEMDAIVLACAGLIRLGLESRITARLDPEVCLPAVSQGVIGIECRGQRCKHPLLAAAARGFFHACGDGCGAGICRALGRQLSIADRRIRRAHRG